MYVIWRLLTCLGFMLVMLMGVAMAARSPLGIGVVEQAINPASPLAGFLLKIQAWQMQFERTIQQILIGMRDSKQGASWLMGVSFLYGILHAAGPGHGKAVISSYLVADHASLKRGITLSFFSSLCQALSAICIIGAIFWLLPGQLTQTTYWVVTLSYTLVMFVGLHLLIRHSLRLYRSRKPVFGTIFDNPSTKQLATLTLTASSSTFMADGSDKPGLAWKGKGNMSSSASRMQGVLCAECGQMHLIAASHLQDKLRLKTAISLICATGLRPCNGALFVMSFALINQLEWVGVMAVLAMALGTFITVTLLACLAVYAKNLTLSLSSRLPTRPLRLKNIIEWAASLFIFITGVLLLSSSLI